MTYLILSIAIGLTIAFTLYLWETENPQYEIDAAVKRRIKSELADISVNRPNHIVSTADDVYNQGEPK